MVEHTSRGALRRGASMESAAPPSPLNPMRRWSPSVEGRPEPPQMAPGVPAAWAHEFEGPRGDVLLGNGAFAKIYRVTERSTGQASAVKVMDRHFFEIRGIGDQIKDEIDALRQCTERGRNRHVVRFLGAIEEAGLAYVRMELCELSLLRYARAQPGNRIAEDEGRNWTSHLYLGLSDIHDLGILHRDIKPDNLLIGPCGALKIADFGWCVELATSPKSLAGTFQYMAPEVLHGEDAQTEAVDVWSGGATLLELLTGHAFLEASPGLDPTGLTNTDSRRATKVRTTMLLRDIMKRCSLQHRPGFLSVNCWDFLRAVLVADPSERMRAGKAGSTAWLRDRTQVEANEGVKSASVASEAQTPSSRSAATSARLSSPWRPGSSRRLLGGTATAHHSGEKLAIEVENTESTVLLSDADGSGSSPPSLSDLATSPRMVMSPRVPALSVFRSSSSPKWMECKYERSQWSAADLRTGSKVRGSSVQEDAAFSSVILPLSILTTSMIEEAWQDRRRSCTQPSGPSRTHGKRATQSPSPSRPARPPCSETNLTCRTPRTSPMAAPRCSSREVMSLQPTQATLSPGLPFNRHRPPATEHFVWTNVQVPTQMRPPSTRELSPSGPFGPTPAGLGSHRVRAAVQATPWVPEAGDAPRWIRSSCGPGLPSARPPPMVPSRPVAPLVPWAVPVTWRRPMPARGA